MFYSNMKERGWTLVELIVVIVLIGILSAIGGNFIVPLVQGYLINSASAQALAAPQAAIWQIRTDYAMTKINSATLANCVLTLNTVNGQVQYTWSQSNLYRNSALLLGKVSASTCPFSLNLSAGKTILNISFTYTGTNGVAAIPVVLALSSFES